MNQFERRVRATSYSYCYDRCILRSTSYPANTVQGPVSCVMRIENRSSRSEANLVFSS
jgi:hypothetical protein